MFEDILKIASTVEQGLFLNYRRYSLHATFWGILLSKQFELLFVNCFVRNNIIQ